MFILGEHIGKKSAHALVRRAAGEAHRDGRSLWETLAEQPEVKANAGRLDFKKLLEPGNYIGLAPQVVDRTIAFIKASREGDT